MTADQREEAGYPRAKPVFKIKLNGIPKVAPMMANVELSNDETFIARQNFLKRNQKLIDDCVKVVDAKVVYDEPTHPDMAIYSLGFMNAFETSWCQGFNAIYSWEEKYKYFCESKVNPKYEGQLTMRTTEIPFYMFGRNAPHVFSEEHQLIWENYVHLRKTVGLANSPKTSSGALHTLVNLQNQVKYLFSPDELKDNKTPIIS
ncbi:hypothetical protein DBZ36_03115 [Alginatibacterium sediminis]|uniref:ExoI C-terminal domain-containing protein n=2 Tax=Alginatibacterium sediminis TaxID=2164068 RepID=A0A420EFM7_9ALTE|nr:hypothetical protein DBZ36_03115 [Alginatibacterium sediminis]